MQYKQTHHGSVDNFLGNEKDSTKVVNDFSNDKAVRKHLTPPAAVFLANDDDIVPILENGVAYYSAMHRVGNHCALYAYPTGGHGFGMKIPEPSVMEFPMHATRMASFLGEGRKASQSSKSLSICS